jgi:16S rRNA (guanine(1405)-N(7))-methyltransferase
MLMKSKKDSFDIELVIEEIMQSKKYRDMNLHGETIRDMIRTEMRHYKNKREIVKAVRKKLHRTVATYLGDPDYGVAASDLETAYQSGDPGMIRAVCADIMLAHASTKERQPILDRFYTTIFDRIGQPEVIIDAACGLNPLAFPWMGLPNTTQYYAYDIHQERVDFLNHYFRLQGLAPLAKVQDILVNFPPEQGDIALIFKVVHTFERRRRGLTLPLLRALRVRYVLVSLPIRNLNGSRDLSEHHRQLFYDIVKDEPWKTTEIAFENEMVFCIDKLA